MLFNILILVLVVFVGSIKSNHVVSAAGGISNQHHQQDDSGNYNFGYEVQDPTSHQFRRESGDAYGRVVGSYGLSEADGRQRIVDYVADEYGFRAKVRTNEPGTGAENSAAVEVLKPGHPPGPPRVPHAVSPAPAPPPPPPPPAPPTQTVLPPPSPVKSYIPYVNAPYSHPYYYSPIQIPSNSLYSLPQNRYPEYIQHPSTYTKFVDPYNYKYGQPSSLQISTHENQKYAPSPPNPPLIPTHENQKYAPSLPHPPLIPTHENQKYAPSLPHPPLIPTQTNFNIPSDASHPKIGLISNKLPSNYRVVPIPNGIQAVPIDSAGSTNLGGGVYQPYNYNPESNYPRVAYPSRDVGNVDTKRQKAYYAYPPTDYRYSGSGRSKTITRISKSVEQ